MERGGIEGKRADGGPSIAVGNMVVAEADSSSTSVAFPESYRSLGTCLTIEFKTM
jgi:hypothetical protein